MEWKSWLVDRNVLLGAAAVTFGACAYLFAHRYLQGQESVARRQLAGEYATRDILVAEQALPAGTALEPGMLAHRTVPERFLASDALDAGAGTTTLGRRLSRALASGEAVTLSALVATSHVELSSLVDPGWRALTIPVDESGAAAGLIAPGDYVDLLVATRADESGSVAAVRPLLQAVRVVATGQQMVRHAHGAAGGGGNGDIDAVDAAPGFATVTLRLPPEDAERVLLAQRLGELAVLLRPAGDFEPGVPHAVDQNNLYGAPDIHRARLSVSRVQFIVGGMGGLARGRATVALDNTGVRP